MSTDSLHQFQQALSRVYSDSHPPVMAWVWASLLRIVPGPTGMLMLQNLLFWSAVALIWAEFGPERWNWLGVLGIGFYPPVLALLGIVWKDVQMGCSMLAAVALVLLVRRHRVPGWWLAPALVLLGYAAAVRFNGILAVGPLLWLWSRTAFHYRLGKQAVATAGLVLVVAGVSWIANRSLTDVEDHLSQQYEVHDLSTLSIERNADLFPATYWAGAAPMSLDELRTIYDPIEPSLLFWSAQPSRHFVLRTNPKGESMPLALTALRTAWWQALERHPWNILRARWSLLTEMFGLQSRYGCYDYVTEMKTNELGIQIAHPRLYKRVASVLEPFRHGVAYRGWIYLGLLFVCVFVGRSIDGLSREGTVVLALSGLGSVGIYPLIGSGCDFRYLWWMVLAALISMLLVTHGLFRSGPETA